jgi:hypothetical protein
MNGMHHHQVDTGTGQFSRDPSGLPMAERTRDVVVHDGDALDLRIAPVANDIAGDTVRMLAYNGSIPGPTLRVIQGSEIVVTVTNDADMPATVHWHGVRLENKYDGVPHDTQKPIAIGERFTYRVRFPDEGVYWYHPHIREDYGIDMGLYGNIVVEPSDAHYWPACDRDAVLTIDDFLLEHGEAGIYDRAAPDHVAMGRFGNVFLVSGRSDWTMNARQHEVVRFFLTNTANTRVFNLRFNGARMKLVGGDSGRYERETFVDDVLLAPSERAVVDVEFDRSGDVTLEHRTPEHVYAIGRIKVAASDVGSAAGASFEDLRTSPELSAERARIGAELQREPDKVLALVAEMDVEAPSPSGGPAYACPMDPEVVSDAPDQVRYEAPADRDGAGRPRAARQRRERPRRRRTGGARTCGGLHRVGRHDGGREPGDEPGQHAVVPRGPTDGTAERRGRLDVHGGRSGEDPDRERDGLRSPDAPPVPHPRRRPVPGPVA